MESLKITILKDVKKKKKNEQDKQKWNRKMVDLNSNLPLTTLNVNGLNTTLKRQIHQF